ncbi:hypothetical protein N1851_013966 [Merluccius polli]|uniref:Uncharacterized protein n=1 Tax=Merluccius polli TaxID=89951 RepID=A0AA47MU51_MERPO|nr:hypothetical protein N1851_013966 [Merluccius polli]
MTELLTLSLRESPATLRRKLISAACTRDLVLSLPLHHDGSVQSPHYCRRRTDPPVDLPLHPPLTREQDPEVLELLHLGQDLIPDPESALHPFPVEDHGLRFGGADSHPGRFTLGCEPVQRELEVTFHGIPHCRCPPAGLGIAATAGTDHLAATVLVGRLNIGGAEHGPLGLNVPRLPRYMVKALPEVGVEALSDRRLCQTFPADPHNTFGSARSDRHSPPPSQPTHHQVVIS